uniref:Major capsid protein N-terminal domain-containing protein n=1 Tax=viral metagenome TaxID=1070528 RepID=A0A6C0LPP4_9ZZZZ
MAGGLLNIISVGNNNIILTGNPSKTFFKVTYSKYSNFGLQKFRIDYDGLRDLRLTEPSTFTFKIPRYAELLMDTYLVVTIPDIWSPLQHPTVETDDRWVAYDFRWIKNLGTHMIKEITITCGSLTLQKYSGEYLAAMVERDFSAEKKDLFNKMSGNVAELNDPANNFGRSNTYPSAYYTNNTAGSEPSIRGRNLYIPINTWFTLDSRCAFPLIALQYNELVINVTLRPIQELFQVRDVYDIQYRYPYIQPDFNESRFQMYRFLQSPPSVIISPENYTNKISTWNADVHLMATYCFLSKDETQVFASQDQVYLVKDVFQYNFENITGTKKVKLNSNGMVANWMFYLQRNDVNMRNEWSNYTNWPYRALPAGLESATIAIDPKYNIEYGPGMDPNDKIRTGIYLTGDFKTDNYRHILETMGILFNGEYRENILTRGVYEYIEKYTRTAGSASEGLFCYNFCLNTSPFEYQPSGAINMSKFKNIELEIATYVPPIDTVNSSFDIICDTSGNAIGVRKSNWKLYQYNYNMTLFEERYNILSFIGGNCGMMYAR